MCRGSTSHPGPHASVMKVHFPHEVESRLHQLAVANGKDSRKCAQTVIDRIQQLASFPTSNGQERSTLHASWLGRPM